MWIGIADANVEFARLDPFLGLHEGRSLSSRMKWNSGRRYGCVQGQKHINKREEFGLKQFQLDRAEDEKFERFFLL